MTSTPASPDRARVELLCPACGSRMTAGSLEPECSACHARVALTGGGGFELGGPLRACAVCKSEAFHIAKDFNKNVGPVVVALGCIGFFWGALAGIASLAALTVVDRLIYYLRPEVTVCYACKSIYRGVVRNPEHHGYELTYDETFEGTGSTPRHETAGPTPGKTGE